MPTTRLVGGYKCELCTDCTNRWHEFVVQHPDFRRLKILGADLAATAAAGYRADTRDLAIEKLDLENGLYELGKRWINE